MLNENLVKARKERGLTQEALAVKLNVVRQTVSKWENANGLPDISLLEPLSAALGVSVSELMTGRHIENRNVSCNLLRSAFRVCPVCGNLVISTGNATVSCCGRKLLPLQAQKADPCHEITAEVIENDWFISSKHEMEKDHYIMWIAQVTENRTTRVKLYPEQSTETRFSYIPGATLYAYCNKHGLWKTTIK